MEATIRRGENLKVRRVEKLEEKMDQGDAMVQIDQRDKSNKKSHRPKAKRKASRFVQEY